MMLRKIRDIFRPPQPSGHPFGLTAPQVEALKRLSLEDDYHVWQDALDACVKLTSEQLLAAGDAFHLAKLQGTLLGLRRAGTLVDEVLQHEAHASAERSRINSKPAVNDAARRLATFGTPAWTDQR